MIRFTKSLMRLHYLRKDKVQPNKYILVTLIVPGSCHSGRLKLNAGFESTAICCSLKSIDFKRQCTLLKKLPKIRETAAAPCPVLKSPLCCLTLNFNSAAGIFGDKRTGLLLTIFWQIY